MVPLAVVVPYSTWESEVSSVVQLMVAELEVIPEALILEITGGALSTVTLTAAVVAGFSAPARGPGGGGGGPFEGGGGVPGRGEGGVVSFPPGVNPPDL